MASDVVTLEAGSTLDLVEHVMGAKRIRHLPVVDNGRLVGLVSQRDLFRAGLSTALRFRRHAEHEWLAQIKVEEVMVRELVTVAPETDIDSALELMLKRRIGCLPVLSGGNLVGLLSETDCLRYLLRILRIADVKRRISEEGALTEIE